MNQEDLRALFLGEVNRIAPDIEPESVSNSDHLQDDLELDSMDILNLVAALHEKLGVSIPEAEYTEIETPEKAVRYLSEKLGAG